MTTRLPLSNKFRIENSAVSVNEGNDAVTL
jgi:hypothetical protein